MLYRDGYVTAERIERNNQLVAVLSDAVTGLAILVGGFVSYMKFFRGRILAPKVNIHHETGVIPLADQTFVWITIGIENRGSVSIMGYHVDVGATLHAPEAQRQSKADIVSFDSLAPSDEYVIDVDETANEHALITVPKDVYAVTFEVAVSDLRRYRWSKFVTVATAQTGDAAVAA